MLITLNFNTGSISCCQRYGPLDALVKLLRWHRYGYNGAYLCVAALAARTLQHLAGLTSARRAVGASAMSVDAAGVSAASSSSERSAIFGSRERLKMAVEREERAQESLGWRRARTTRARAGRARASSRRG